MNDRQGSTERSVVPSWVDRMFFTTATVAKVADIAESFRLIELEGPALRKSRGGPGDKIQVRAARFGMRTYTPVGWDADRGRTRICAFTHGAGPGARWVSTLREGDPCSFFGPRGSVSLAKITGPIVLFGDETSLGIAAALSALGVPGSRIVLEATSSAAATRVVNTLELGSTDVVAKTSDDAHLQRASELVAEAATASDVTVVLTGRARSIVEVRRLLRQRSVSAAIKSKAYWADGRTGLD